MQTSPENNPCCDLVRGVCALPTALLRMVLCCCCSSTTACLCLCFGTRGKKTDEASEVFKAGMGYDPHTSQDKLIYAEGCVVSPDKHSWLAVVCCPINVARDNLCCCCDEIGDNESKYYG